jgi:hypothetical protein
MYNQVSCVLFLASCLRADKVVKKTKMYTCENIKMSVDKNRPFLKMFRNAQEHAIFERPHNLGVDLCEASFKLLNGSY